MEQAPWAKSARRARLGWQLASGLLALLLLLSLGIPSVRAALSAWLGLSVAPANQAPAETLTLVPLTMVAPTASPTPTTALTAASVAPAPTSIPTLAPARDLPPEVSQIAAQVGWNILTPSRLPEGYALQSAYYDANHQMVILTYLATRPLPGATDASQTATQTITLLQALQNDFVPMQVAPDTRVEDTLVNGQAAVFTTGAWDTQFVANDQDPNGGQMVSTWRNDLPIQNLYWQVGQMYLLLVSDDPTLSQQDLIGMASSCLE
jgi:hypothetical protein